MPTGLLQSKPIIPTSSGYSSSIYDSRQRISTNPKATTILKDVTLFNGARAIVAPISVSHSNKSGLKSISFLDDFYYRTHISPPDVNVGNLLSTKVQIVEVWNAHFIQNSLPVINEVLTEGIALTGQAPPPVNYSPLQSKKYTLTVTPNGSPTIGAQYKFPFTLDSYIPTLTISGLRVLAWWPSANWSDKIIERLEWLTDVMISRNKKEKRIKNRLKPRRSYEFSCLIINNKQRQIIENLLFAWQSRVFGLPIWTDQQLLGQTLNEGSYSIPCLTDGLDYEVGSLIGLFLDEQHEIGTITDVTLTHVTVSAPLLKTWPPQTKVVPVRTARIESKQQIKRETDSILTMRVRFKIEAPDFRQPLVEPATYLSYAVLEKQTNYNEDVTTSYERDLSVIDFGTGITYTDDLSDIQTMLSSYQWQIHGKDNIKELRKFLYARYGKLKPIWVPTFNSDFVLTQLVSEASSILYVENTDYTRTINLSVQRRDIRIQLNNGTIFYRRILQCLEESTTVERLQIDSPFGIQVLPSDIRLISFMSLCRLDSDALELSWQTNETVEVSSVFRSIRDDV